MTSVTPMNDKEFIDSATKAREESVAFFSNAKKR